MDLLVVVEVVMAASLVVPVLQAQDPLQLIMEARNMTKMITIILTVGRTPIKVVGAAVDTQLELVRDP